MSLFSCRINKGQRALHPGSYRIFVGGAQPGEQVGVAFEITGEKTLEP